MRKTAATIVLAFGDDRLLGSPRANTIYAEDGNARVLGRGGEDALKGGDGHDEVYGQEGSDRVKGSAAWTESTVARATIWYGAVPQSGQTTGRATFSSAATARGTRSTLYRDKVP